MPPLCFQRRLTVQCAVWPPEPRGRLVIGPEHTNRVSRDACQSIETITFVGVEPASMPTPRQGAQRHIQDHPPAG